MTDANTLLNAALAHVPFDGWTQAALDAALAECGMEPSDGKALFPRGPVDMALAFHRQGDAAMVDKLKAADLSAMRYRDRIAAGVRFRLESADRELVRRGMTLFSLPQHAGDGAKAVWDTCGLIWDTLGDSSDDVNWYTKRVTLSAVYGATVLFWLGDESDDHAASWDFLDRRITNVMSFEKVKGQARQTKLYQAFMSGPGKVLDTIKAPGKPRDNYPGHWGAGETRK